MRDLFGACKGHIFCAGLASATLGKLYLASAVRGSVPLRVHVAREGCVKAQVVQVEGESGQGEHGCLVQDRGHVACPWPAR
jgi:hypothetical protein